VQSVTSTNADDFLVAAVSISGTPSATGTTGVFNYETGAHGTGSGISVSLADVEETSAGTYTATFTLSASSAYTIATAALKVASTAANVTGAAALTGSGSAAAAGVRRVAGAAALTGTGTAAVTGYKDGDLIRVVATAHREGNDTLTLVGTIAGQAARAGNTLAAIFASQSQFVGSIANSTGTDTWSLNEATRQNSAATDSVCVSSCRLTADLAVAATVTVTPAAAAASKNMILLEFQGALTLEAGTPGGGDSGVTLVTSLAAAAGGATNQAESTVIVGAVFAGGDPGTLTATGYTQPAGATVANSSGTIRFAAALYRETTTSETPSAALSWVTSRAAAAAIAAYGKPVTATTGAAALTGTGSLSAAGVHQGRAAAALTGAGTLASGGRQDVHAAAALTGTGSLSATGRRIVPDGASLFGTGSLSASGKRTRFGAAALTGAGTLAASGVRRRSGAAALTGAGSVSAAGVVTHTAAAALHGRGGLMATGTPGGWAWDRGAFDGGGRANAIALDPNHAGTAVIMGDVWGFFETVTGGDVWYPIMGGAKVHPSGVAGDVYGRSVVFSQKHSGRAILGVGTLTGGPSGWWGHHERGALTITKDSTLYGFGTTGGEAGLNPRPTGQLQAVDYDSGGNIEYVYAGTNQGLVRMKDDAGGTITFTVLGATSEPNDEWKFVCVAPDGSVYAGSYGDRGAGTPTSGTVYRVTSPRTTGTVTADSGAPSYVNDMKVINGTLWACTQSGGLYTVAPGGSWTQVSSSFFSGCDLASVAGAGSTIYVATASHPSGSDKWLAKSTDGGSTWSWLQNVVETVQGTGRHFWLDPAGDGDSKGPDDSWATLHMDVDPTNANVFMLAAFRGAWASQDGGATWHPALNGLGGSEVAKVEIQIDGSIENTDVDWHGAVTSDWYASMTPLASAPTLGTASLADITIGGHTYSLTLPTTGAAPDITVDGVSIADDYFRAACMAPDDWDVSADGQIVIGLFGGGILRALPAATALSTTGAANLTGTGTLTAAGHHDVPNAAAALSGSGTLAASGRRTRLAAAALTGAGTATITGVRIRLAAAHLTGAGTLTSGGRQDVHAAAHLTGTGSLSANGSTSAGVLGQAHLTGLGALTAAGVHNARAAAALTGAGTLAAAGTRTRLGAVAAAGTGSLSATGRRTRLATATLTGAGSLTASGRMVAFGAAALSGHGSLTASFTASAHPVTTSYTRASTLRNGMTGGSPARTGRTRATSRKELTRV
jgi:hypothetical protein